MLRALLTAGSAEAVPRFNPGTVTEDTTPPAQGAGVLGVASGYLRGPSPRGLLWSGCVLRGPPCRRWLSTPRGRRSLAFSIKAPAPGRVCLPDPLHVPPAPACGNLLHPPVHPGLAGFLPVKGECSDVETKSLRHEESGSGSAPAGRWAEEGGPSHTQATLRPCGRPSIQLRAAVPGPRTQHVFPEGNWTQAASSGRKPQFGESPRVSCSLHKRLILLDSAQKE